MGMKFGFLSGLLALVGLGLISCGTNNTTTAASASGILYVVTQGNSSVSAFGIDLANGTVTTNGNATATGNMPAAMILTASAAFVANRQDNTISSYTFNSDGTLTVGSTTNLTNASTPMGMAIDSAGKFLFVANQGSNNVSVFSISSASLTEVAGSPFPTNDPRSPSVATGPASVAVTPGVNFLYVANQFSNTVGVFSIGASGALTQIFGTGSSAPPYPAGLSPASASLAATPTGNFLYLYVANQGSNNISAFAVCAQTSLTCTAADGSLNPVQGSPFAAGLGPVAMAGAFAATSASTTTSASLGSFLYVVDRNSNQVSEFKISTGTGALSINTQAAISTGSNPSAIVIGTGPGTLLADGGTTNYVYVANQTDGTVSSYSYDTTTGVLNLVGNAVTTQGQPSALAVK